MTAARALAACLLVLALCGQASAQAAAQAKAGPKTAAPLEIAGLRLGANVREMDHMLDLEAAEEELVRQYLTVVAVKPLAGYRSGYVTFGNCRHPGRIVRIKLNYEDPSPDFFEKILATLKSRYGDPDEWRGNPFGTLRTWKWSFKDASGGDVSLILQHYAGDDDAFTRGNSIRLSSSTLIEQEMNCQSAKRKPPKAAPRQAPTGMGPEWFLPH